MHKQIIRDKANMAGKGILTLTKGIPLVANEIHYKTNK